MVYAGLLNKLYCSLVTLFLVVFGVLVSLCFFQPLAELLMGAVGWTKQFGYAVVMMLLFLGTYLLGYALAMARLPGKLELNKYVNTVGGGLMGLLTGIVFSGFMLLALYLFPLAGYQGQKQTFLNTDETVVKMAALFQRSMPWEKFDAAEFLHWVKTSNVPAPKVRRKEGETDAWGRPVN
jgi:hypothetical protein